MENLEESDHDPLESILSAEGGNEETVIEDPVEQKPICDLDNLVLHLESLKRKSPPKKVLRKSRSTNREELLGSMDVKPLVLINDDVDVQCLLDEMIDRVDRKDVPLSNLVFSTLGCQERREPDDISAYLESSSSESSRSLSPSPAPIHDHDLYLDENEPNSDYSSNKIVQDEMSPNLSKRCGVHIERLKLTQAHRNDIKYYYKSSVRPVEKVSDLSKINHKIRKKIRENKKILRKTHSGLSKETDNLQKLKRWRFGKRWRCGSCYACKKPDCRKCLFCRDMKKYGGKGVKKQSCIERPHCVKMRGRSKQRMTSSVRPLVRSKQAAAPEQKVELKTAAPPAEVKARPQRISVEEVEGLCKTNLSRSDSPAERPKLNKYATVNGSEDLLIRKNKMDQIKEKFKLQEKALKAGKTSMLNLSKEELLFGFHL